MSMTKTVYLLDKLNSIISVDGSWDEFAAENEGRRVRASDVCGRSIWEFVTGDATRMWLETVFNIVRFRESAIERPYRCDSPELKRYMRMHVIPEKGGILRLEHHVVGTEERATPIYFNFCSDQAGKSLRVRCSMCGRLKSGETWVEPQAHFGDKPLHVMVAYSVCGDCLNSVSG